VRNPGKLPLFIKRDGLVYEVIAPYSIQQKIDSEMDEARHLALFIKGLNEKFPNDMPLNNYLNRVGPVMHDRKEAYIKDLNEVKADLSKSGGELYVYKSYRLDNIDTNAIDNTYVDEGLMILVKGKIYKTY
jgi:hypothetical protein